MSERMTSFILVCGEWSQGISVPCCTELSGGRVGLLVASCAGRGAPTETCIVRFCKKGDGMRRRVGSFCLFCLSELAVGRKPR